MSKIKKCKLCNGILREIGTIEPDTAYASTKYPSISPFDGIGYFVLFLIIGFLVSIPLWDKNTIVAAIIISLFGGLGAYLWQKPKVLYRCTKCGSEYYGKHLSNYER